MEAEQGGTDNNEQRGMKRRWGNALTQIVNVEQKQAMIQKRKKTAPRKQGRFPPEKKGTEYKRGGVEEIRYLCGKRKLRGAKRCHGQRGVIGVLGCKHRVFLKKGKLCSPKKEKKKKSTTRDKKAASKKRGKKKQGFTDGGGKQVQISKGGESRGRT